MTWPRVDQNFKLAQKDQFDIIEGDDVEVDVDDVDDDVDVELRWIKGIPGREVCSRRRIFLMPSRRENGKESFTVDKCACVKCREDGVAGLRSL